MTLVEAILAFGGGGVVTGVGVKLFDILAKRGGAVAETALREGTRRKIAKIKLSGDTQEDLSKVLEWSLNEFKAGQTETHNLYAEVHRLRIENEQLKIAFDKMKEAREDGLRANTELVRQVASLVEQAKNLQMRLANKEREFALLSLDHEGAKSRIEAQTKMIADMQQWLDDATAREAKLEAELERSRIKS